jgi:uncharacterized LabA/DUF88 family protein
VFSNPALRTAIFIDGPDLYAASRKLGFDIDFRRLLCLFRDNCRLVRAHYYAAVAQNAEFQAIRPLLDWLDYNGFTIVTKGIREFSDDANVRKSKCNFRVSLAVDAMRLAPHLDHVVLFSGDGEFQYLVTALKDMGKRVSVVSTLQTEPPMVGDELRRRADAFVDLAELRESIGRSLKIG